MPRGFGEGGLPPLSDARGRSYSYLRVSVTDRCDLACQYCMPPSGEDDHALRPELLTFEEVARLGQVFARMGITRLRFTGGEPLVRRDIVRLVELVSACTGLDDLVMTTNATRLAELAHPLRRAGLRGVNVSIDSLDSARFGEITRGGSLSRVLAGIHAALDAGLEVKTNTVLLGGINDQDAEAIIDWAFELGITPRFIELMPLGEAAKLAPQRFMSRSELMARLSSRIDPAASEASGETGLGPARYWPARDGSGRRVGFITAVSEEFCGSCNRVRVTARGDIRACLASRGAISLRDMMRSGATDAELAWGVHQSLGVKREGHFFNDVNEHEHEQVGMSLIGG